MIIGATRRKDRANFLGGVSATTVAMYGYDGVSRSEAPSPNATPPLKISGVSVPRVFLVPPRLDPQRTENEGIAPIYRVSPLFSPNCVSGEISPLVRPGKLKTIKAAVPLSADGKGTSGERARAAAVNSTPLRCLFSRSGFESVE